MNKKAQIDFPVITFVFVIFGLLLIAPIILKIFYTTQNTISPQLGNLTGGAVAQTNFNAVMNVATTFWDKVIIFAFISAVITLFISAFLIDSSPFWLILYIIIALMVILFAPNIIDSLGNIYDSAQFAQESNALSFVGTLRTYFAEFLVGIIVMTGIIIYGKIAFFSNGGRR